MDFLGRMPAHSEGKTLNRSNDPEGKIDSVEQENPLVLRKAEVHGHLDECVHSDDHRADEQQADATEKHEKGEQFHNQSGCIDEHVTRVVKECNEAGERVQASSRSGPSAAQSQAAIAWPRSMTVITW